MDKNTKNVENLKKMKYNDPALEHFMKHYFLSVFEKLKPKKTSKILLGESIFYINEDCNNN
jgi:hypothetical protein